MQHHDTSCLIFLFSVATAVWNIPVSSYCTNIMCLWCWPGQIGVLMRILFENSIFLFEDAQKGMLVREDNDLWQTGEMVTMIFWAIKISFSWTPDPWSYRPRERSSSHQYLRLWQGSEGRGNSGLHIETKKVLWIENVFRITVLEKFGNPGHLIPIIRKWGISLLNFFPKGRLKTESGSRHRGRAIIPDRCPSTWIWRLSHSFQTPGSRICREALV